MTYFDKLETRSADQRAGDQAQALREQIARVTSASGYAAHFADADTDAVSSAEDLVNLPVLRKSEISRAQGEHPPLGGFTVKPAHGFAHIFQSPGPIYEPGGVDHDWWRMGRFLHAAGIGQGDIVQNCFGYHLTPAGMIFENGARAVGATVLPAGTGQT
ncbi:MAG: phenylacetate--CoA ligase family protein, partial [Ruegeria sp.]